MIGLAEQGGNTDITNAVMGFFSEGGNIQSIQNFETRPEQSALAIEVSKALSSNQPLIAEAGTGVGKSLAYLIPTLLYSKRTKKKAIVSTHTINLQEQLIQKDIPLASELLDMEVKAMLYKGRGNYLCPTRLSRALKQTDDLFTTTEHQELKRLAEWASTTTDGTRSDLPFMPPHNIWSQVCSEAGVCSSRLCDSRTCFYQRARIKVNEAELIVMNHSLFFSLLDTEQEDEKQKGLIFADDFIIFDEAHTLEHIAAKGLGLNLSQSKINFLLRRLYNPKTRKGLFSAISDGDGARITNQCLETVEDFFFQLEESCHFQKPSLELRVRSVDIVPNTLALPLGRLVEKIKEASDHVKGEGTKAELIDIGLRIASFRIGLNDFLNLEQENHAYWVQKQKTSTPSLTLHSAAIDVSADLRPLLFEQNRECILTSATLGTGDSNLSYFKNRIGGETARSLKIGSPFDFEKQMTLHIAQSIPPPQSKEYAEVLPDWILHFLKKNNGSALVLFTSYQLLKDTAAKLKFDCDKHGWNLLLQGTGDSPSRLLNKFKENKNSILFGTDSFWTGVDIPGDSLKTLILTKLPFAVPNHPLIEARHEAIEEAGGSSFKEYSLPEAVIKFRQGIGRLIRRKTDSGDVVILDNRVLSKPYGKDFLKSIPDCTIKIVKTLPQ